MVFTKVGADHNVLHVTYYETGHTKQGTVDLTLDNQSDASKIHDDDTVELIGLVEALPGEEVTVVVHHPDSSVDEIKTLCA